MKASIFLRLLMVLTVAGALPARGQTENLKVPGAPHAGFEAVAMDANSGIALHAEQVLEAEPKKISPDGTNGLSLVGNVSYSITGSTVELTADRVENANASRTSGTLQLWLWMSATGYRATGYKTAVYQFGDVLGPNQYFYDISHVVSFTSPPTGCYFVSMLLAEYQPSGSYSYVDYVDFSNKIGVNGGCGAPPPVCSFSLDSSGATSGSSTANGSVTVTGSPSGCTGSYSAYSNDSWIVITGGATGSGSGAHTLSFSVGANASSNTRTGSMNIAGYTYVVTQSGVSAPPPNTGCQSSDTGMCLSSRFIVSATWQTNDGSSGQGHAVALTGDTGYFWFFSASNVETVVKVLNGCGLNGTYWVFAGGLTNVRVTITVRDTVTGTQKTYTNPLNTAFQPIQDTSAFATCH